jgi:hypothetical protein
MRRFLVIAALVALAVAIAAAIWVARSLDGAVARTIEQVGSELLDARVSVEHVRVELREGRARVSGLAIANPGGPALGFSAEPALSLAAIEAELDLAALDLAAIRAGSAPISLGRVRIEGARVNAEVGPNGVNLEHLRQNLLAAAPSEESQPHSEAGEPLRLRIARLELDGGRLRADTSRVGGGVEEVAIPDFALERLGGAEGAEVAEVGAEILDALLRRSLRAAARAGLGSSVDRLREEAREKLRGLFD